MIFSFNNQEIEEIYKNGKSRKYTQDILKSFFKKMDIISMAKDENDIRKHKGLHFEKLKSIDNLYSIRLTLKYRLEFTFTKEKKIKILIINNISNHYD